MDFFGGSAPEDKPAHAGYRQKEKAWVLDDFTEWLNEMSLEPSYSGLLEIHDNKPFIVSQAVLNWSLCSFQASMHPHK